MIPQIQNFHSQSFIHNSFSEDSNYEDFPDINGLKYDLKDLIKPAYKLKELSRASNPSSEEMDEEEKM
jgi:hypothetical protein